ncbi:MAG: hypothetical protein KA105_07860 [Caulobacter sp.]|nr:hypothetical protein [Caulobacter sp.]
MTNLKPTLVERAYQLAHTGMLPTIGAIKRKLQSEGYGEIDAHLDGPQVRAALRALIAEAQRGVG